MKEELKKELLRDIENTKELQPIRFRSTTSECEENKMIEFSMPNGYTITLQKFKHTKPTSSGTIGFPW